MAQKDFFPERPKVTPQIYAYSNPHYPGWLKVGYTAHDVKKRIAQQHPIITPDEGLPYTIEYKESSMRNDGTAFTDKLVHR